ncbi:hypothetical protein DACRYDRAFT_111426 [Dacryopinax primogenitus]|uniref:Uncharacterized protein n=1 Tax=Dacryopinax primogenitus (strain DJM 731) TaxID=1858805 RepID=M5G2B4_DACPD|nr:uncharacterized protein DACRYDRAFT_111426 [Dacryopinax primogenitus]EJT97907.1 hypothetical protein DACRYDRAFT_111426 [Dacryopinax primogenitus]
MACTDGQEDAEDGPLMRALNAMELAQRIALSRLEAQMAQTYNLAAKSANALRGDGSSIRYEPVFSGRGGEDPGPHPLITSLTVIYTASTNVVAGWEAYYGLPRQGKGVALRDRQRLIAAYVGADPRLRVM